MRTKTKERTMKTIKDDTMKRINLLIALAGIALVLVLSTGTSAQDKMETRDTRIGKLVFENGYPDHKTLERLYDERDFQRACQAYLWSLPAISMMDFVISFQEDLGARFGDLIHIKGYDDACHGTKKGRAWLYVSPIISGLKRRVAGWFKYLSPAHTAKSTRHPVLVIDCL